MAPGAHPGPGTVVSWTRIERPPQGFTPPQRVLLVQLDGSDAHPLGPLVLAATDEDSLLESGTRVQVGEQEEGRLVANAED